MKHIIHALVENKPGVLAHVSGVFAARGLNIDSLVVGRTEDAKLSHITLVVVGDDATVEQVRKHLSKIVPVVKVQNFAGRPLVTRELVLLSLTAPPEKRPELCALVDMFHARIVDIGLKTMMIEVSGPENEIEAFLEMCRPYGIKSLARSGTIAMPRRTGATSAV